MEGAAHVLSYIEGYWPLAAILAGVAVLFVGWVRAARDRERYRGLVENLQSINAHLANRNRYLEAQLGDLE